MRDLVLLIKRFYKPDWGDNWRERFSVDLINGQPGRELIYRRQRLVAQYLRVGFTEDGTWRTFSVRKDFAPAKKIQTEDDITASMVVPRESVRGLHPGVANPSVKFIKNCEYRLFQRPDDAIIRGYDKKTESDFSQARDVFLQLRADPPQRGHARWSTTRSASSSSPADAQDAQRVRRPRRNRTM